MNVFHDVVNEDFVEYFILDIVNNLENLIIFSQELKSMYRWKDTKKSRMKIKKQKKFIKRLKSILNEEFSMLDELVKFRKLTKAEKLELKKINRMRESKEIQFIEKMW